LLEAYAARLRAFHEGLKDAGFVEGQNVAIEYRWAEGQLDRLPAQATELVRRQVAVIVADASIAAFAAKGATRSPSSLPPPKIRSGLVLSPASPGRTAT
jgi:putative ABC transport system substrate-binding protein